MNTKLYYYTVTNDDAKTTTTETSLAVSKQAATLSINTTQNVTFYIKICNNDNSTSCSNYASYDLKLDTQTIKVTAKVVGTAPSKNSWATKRTYNLTNNSSSGTEYYEYTVSNTNTKPTDSTIDNFVVKRVETSEVTINETANYVFFRVKDKAGTLSDWTSAINAYIDSDPIEAPTVTSSDNILSGKWHEKAFTLTAKTTSTSLSGITYKYYTSSNSTTQTATNGAVKHSTNTEDSPVVYYFVACNKAGTCSDPTEYTVKLDTTTLKAPTVKHSVTTWTAGPKVYELTQTDDTSIQRYEYYVSDSSTVPNFNVEATGITDNVPEIGDSGTYVFFRAVKDTGKAGTWTAAQKLYVNRSYLTDIEVDGFELEPAFTSNTENYTLTVPYETTHIDITYTPYYNTTTATLTNVDELQIGENNIYINCENGTSNVTYKIVVTRERDKTNTLNSVTISDNVTTYDYELESAFDEEINDYTVYVSEDCTTITISAIPVNENETISGIGEKTINVRETVFSIIVTSDNGEVNVYNITVIRET